MNSEETLFAGALDLPAGDRAAYLRRACGDDVALADRVAALLQGYDGAGARLETSPQLISGAAAEAVIAGQPLDYAPGTWIGRYKLLQKIGEGGCGVIFMAEQTVPVHRRVAVKIIKLGMDTKEVIARFEAERQALAMMDHPHIAHVLDAGTTERGRPFFVMELVRGIPITKHCDEHRIDADGRLRLFIQICHAVQHAHQKGIIHRDLKPSNILVTMHDGVPVPKIIDFGIAKAMHGRLTDRTLFTAFEQFIGTPAYMSPEQTEMSGLDVDTRSDIYSLGVLLYELLTGRTPFGAQDLIKAGLDEMRRIIRNDEPPKPSTCLVTLDATDRATIARQRGTDVPQLSTLLRGDLDWIVMRAIEKDRTRRYETASNLAADIEHHLRNEPVTARPPSPAYLLQRLVRRHKVVFAAVTGIVAALATGLIFSMWSLSREHAARLEADTEAARSAQVARFMQDMLAGVRPQAALGRDTKMLRAILDETVERLPRELRGQPELEASLRETLGNVYRDLGELRSAALMHETALQLRRQVFGPEHPQVASSHHQLGYVYVLQGRLAEAETTLQSALVMRIKLLGPEHALVAETRATLENILLRRRQQAEGILPAADHASEHGDRAVGSSPLADKPAVIRLAVAGGRSGGQHLGSGSILTIAHQRGVLEREFGADGIRVEWANFQTGAEMVEAFSRERADFGQLGALALSYAQAAGLSQRLVLGLAENNPGYIVVRADTSYRNLAELKGRRFGTVRGTVHHLNLCRIFERNGFTAADFILRDFANGPAILTALKAGELDAHLISIPFDLEARGEVRVVFDTGRDPSLADVTGLCVTAEFERKYPAIVQRVVTALLKSARWSSDEQNRDALFRLLSESDRSYAAIEKSWSGITLKERLSPLLDPFFLTRLQQTAADARRLGIIEGDMNPAGRVDARYLNAALEELQLRGVWPERDASGQTVSVPVRPDTMNPAVGGQPASQDSTTTPAGPKAGLPATKDKPAVIRIAHTGGRSTGQTFNSGTILSTASQTGLLEREFSVDGIRIEWLYFPSGTATMEAVAQGRVDFMSAGASGLVGGLDNKLLLRAGNNGVALNYLVVRAEAPFGNLADLKGRRLGTVRGTGGHLTLCRILERHGFRQEDFTIIFFDGAAALATALKAGEVDGYYMSRPHEMVARGEVKVIHDATGELPEGPGGGLGVAREFEQHYPAIVQRIVTAMVRLAAWHCDENNREQVLAVWTKAGRDRAEIEQSWAARPLKERYSPLLDDYYFAQWRRIIADQKRFGLIDTEVSLEGSAEPKYLESALKQLKLEDYWPEHDAEGKPVIRARL